jgi:uncharacterized membrane protein HdeD (DUF308 family)
MTFNSPVSKRALQGRVVYQLFSGILFIILGIIIFIRSDGLKHFFSAGLMAVLLAGFGVYRILLFLRIIKGN